jgi:hypothetical protein
MREQIIEHLELMRLFYEFDRAYGLIHSGCRPKVEFMQSMFIHFLNRATGYTSSHGPSRDVAKSHDPILAHKHNLPLPGLSQARTHLSHLGRVLVADHSRLVARDSLSSDQQSLTPRLLARCRVR